MTSGGKSGTGGVPRSAWLVAAAGPILFAGVNIWTRLHEQPALADRAWEVLTWELSSALVTLALMPLAAYAAVGLDHPAEKGDSVFRARAGTPRAPGVGAPGRALRLRLAAIAVCAAAFVILHILGFVLLRKLAYRLHGSAYVFGGAEAWLYELPKDLVTFAVLFAVFAVMRARPPRAEVDGAGEAQQTPPDRRLRIRDGLRTYVVDPAEILAVAAAGNYVEYHLRDGRRPLSRARLADAEADLAPHGFRRTHRSWLVNPAQIREIRTLGSGDQELRLSGELAVPVSRRYASALVDLAPR